MSQRVTFSSFEALTIELALQADGQSVISIKEERRIMMETTDSTFGNIMPSAFPNPEQVLLNLESRLERAWETDNTEESMHEFVRRMRRASRV